MCVCIMPGLTKDSACGLHPAESMPCTAPNCGGGGYTLSSMVIELHTVWELFQMQHVCQDLRCN